MISRARWARGALLTAASRDLATPAFRFLCHAARPFADPARTQDFVDNTQDWHDIITGAGSYGLRPALIAALSAVHWRGVPDETRGELEKFQRRHLVHTLELAEALAQICRELRGHDIPFAFFKGMALSVQLYGQMAAREYNDLDLIVPAIHLARIEGLLAKLGYQSAFSDPVFRRFFQGYQGQCAFQRRPRGAALDVHWSFGGSFLRFPLRDGEIWSRVTNVAIGGTEVPTLARDDVALLLAGHGTKEGWRSLMWLRDFAVLVDRWRDLDWRRIHGRATANGCGDSVLLGCCLVQRLLAVPIPAVLAPEVAASGRVARLADAVAHRLAEGTTERRHLEDVALCDRRRDRLKACLGFALAPTPSDFRMLPLPRPLWPAYFVLRPVRLAVKAVRGQLPFPRMLGSDA